MNECEIIVGTEVNNDDASSTSCRLKKRTLMLLLLIIGGAVGGVVYWIVGGKDDTVRNTASADVPVVTTAAPTVGDPLVEELRSLNATSDKDLGLFSDRTFPQRKALDWMKSDSIIMESDRSTQDLLQRYALAILYYSTNGPNWDWGCDSYCVAYLSHGNVCSWNIHTECSCFGLVVGV